MESGARGPPGPGENRGLKGCRMRPGHREVVVGEGGVPAPPGVLGWTRPPQLPLEGRNQATESSELRVSALPTPFT